MAWFPSVPPVNVDANAFSFKQWFKTLYRFAFGETHAALSQTASLNAAEEFLYPVDATSGAVTITLPLAANYAYKKYAVKKTDASANTVTIACSGSDTIDGSTTKILTSQYDWIILFSNGASTWFQISSSTGGGGTTIVNNLGQHLLLLGDIQDAKETAETALAMIGAASSQTILTGGTVWLTMIGGGGGGKTAVSSTSSGAGGGSAEYCMNMQIKLTPGSTIAYSIGGGGATDTAGTDTTFGNYTAKAGGTATASSTASGAGGGTGGAAGVVGATNSPGFNGISETPSYFGGGSGGGKSTSTSGVGGAGGGSGGYTVGGLAGGNSASIAGGGGGAASPWGVGGAGGGGGAAGSAASSTHYGSGGGGGSGTAAGAAGAGGYILLAWVGGSLEITTGSGNFTVPL